MSCWKKYPFKVYFPIIKEASYRTVFKSSANLKTLLTSKNKSKLPKLDHPGVYMIDCNCRKKYVGETKLKIATRMEQHQKSITDKNGIHQVYRFTRKPANKVFNGTMFPF